MEPGRPPRSVHEADIARLAAAQQVIAQAHATLAADAGNRVTPADRRWAHYYVSRVLAADDDTGRRDGWITRGDLVRWGDLLALGRAAAQQLDPEHVGQDVTGCEPCALSLAVRRLREAAVNAGFGGRRDPAGPPAGR